MTSAGTAALLTSVEVQNFVYFTSQTAYGYATKVEGKMPHSSGSPDAIGVLRAFDQTLFEMVLGRSVDNFLTYVAQLLALVFKENPDVLKSQEKLSYQEVLECTTMEEVIAHLAERRVHDLSYKGMCELQSYVERRMGFPLFESNDELKRAIHLIEHRNVIAHNRGVVSRVFLARVKGADALVEGTPLRLTFDETESDMRFLLEAVLSIDGRASSKWNLATQTVGVFLESRGPWRVQEPYGGRPERGETV